ncbi:putative methyltransferase type 12 protein [Lasiodiplodia theobromae]|nr:putative methyltransferase type 12 protein [Lasiodiplodia theobromae]
MAKASSSTEPDTSAGVAAYSSTFLRFVYDYLVLGLYCSFAWRCPARPTLTSFFNSHVRPSPSSPASADPGRATTTRRRILDIGVGTGYFLEQAPLSGIADVFLVDLNKNCLDRTAPRVRAAHPHVNCVPVQADFLQPGDRLSPEALGGTFDAVSAMLLLHCLPGPPARKAAALVALRHLVEPEAGVLFGATILGDSVGHGVMGRFLMNWHNSAGIFDNRADDAESFVGPLKEAFRDVKWRVEGAMLLFEAKSPIF